MSGDSKPQRGFRLVAANRHSPRLRLYRGTSLDKMSPEDILALLQGEEGQPETGLKSVIDIRTGEEIGGRETYPLPDGVPYRVMQLTASGDFTELRPADGDPRVTFYRVDFYTLRKKLKIFLGLFWNNWRLALSGWRSERFDTTYGVKMGIIMKLSSDVANSKGQTGLYLDWLDPDMDCSSVVALFKLFGRSEIYPALLHCNYGKDRTGAVSALLKLMDPCLTEEQVVQDYHYTETHLARFIPELEKRIKKACMPPECARCPEQVMRDVIAWIRTRFGSVDQYLLHIGLQESEVLAIKTCLGYQGDSSTASGVESDGQELCGSPDS